MNNGISICLTYGIIVMKLDPRQLEILLAIARSGSLTGAAQLLNMSQPGVSAAIAQLERTVRVRLFERGRHGARPTERGRLLIRRAEAIEQMIDQARKEVELAAAGVSGPIVVAGTPGALLSIVPKAVEELRQLHGRFELHVVEVTQESRLIDMLRDRSADLTVSTVGLENPPEGIVEISVARDPLEVVVGQDHPLDRRSVSLHELAGLPWVLPAAIGAFRRHIDALFLAESVRQPDDVILCDSLGTTKAIIERGRYVTILPRSVVAAEMRTGSLRTIPLTQQRLKREIGIRHLAKDYLPPVVEAFIQAAAWR